MTAARALFAARGFAQVRGDEIATAAGVTRGALYYQFGGSEGLFKAVAEAIAKGLVERIFVETMKDTPPEVDELEIGGGLLLNAFSDKETAAILLRDAPGVYGWTGWMAMMEGAGIVGLIDHALGHWVEAGLLNEAQRTPTARLLFGSLVQAAQAIAADPQPRAAARRYRESMAWMIAGLRGTGR